MSNLKLATFGGGCFWCTETVFLEVKGIEKVISGYAGGDAPGRPTYREICSGLTGHAEVIQITYDPSMVSYETILIIFMTSHNPTQLNRQGADVGSQYRSVVFFHDQKQQEIAQLILKELAPHFNTKIVTEISPLTIFYEAEKEHQDYYRNNQNSGYCNFVINPKLQKLRAQHADKLK
tara:strand:- start:344 stop:877 length:534 start_codon:yes stop_codon:yes gene_type:complete